MPVQLDTATAHARAVRQTGDLIAATRPDQMGDSTPCSRWTVRDLVNHVVGVSRTFAVIGAGGSAPPRGGETPDFLGDDPSGAYEAAAADATAAFAEPGALERPWKLFFGDVPGAVVRTIHIVDLTSHAWDLARATGQMDRLDPELGETVLALAPTIVQDSFRNDGGDPFRPQVSVPDGAPVYDRLAGYLGRQP